jgi:hypothetical protein
VLKTHWDENSTKSEFDRNYQNYGYNILDNGDWSKEDTNYQECADIANSFNQQLYTDNNTMAGFSTANYLNLGMPVADINKMTMPESSVFMRNNIFDFKDRYIKQFKNYYKL